MFNTVEDAVNAIAAGKMIIVVDDADRENEGDLVMAASRATAEQVAFIIRHTSGIVCAPVTYDEARPQCGILSPQRGPCWPRPVFPRRHRQAL